MGRELTPEERRELLGVYALGALDDDERDEVEALVLDDVSARAELHRLQLGVAWLDHASTRAPMYVWSEIARAIGDESESPEPVVVSLDRRRPAPTILAVAAVVAALIVVALGALVARDRGESPSVAALAARAVEAPGADVVALRSPDGSRAGRVVVGPDRRAYLVWSDAPSPVAASRTYQLWELRPDGPRSAGLLGPNPQDLAFPVGAEPSGFAVTVEPAGGSLRPTGNPVVVATRA